MIQKTFIYNITSAWSLDFLLPFRPLAKRFF